MITTAEDHLTAAENHLTAAEDHLTAAEDHLTAAEDHLTAASDHLTAALPQSHRPQSTPYHGWKVYLTSWEHILLPPYFFPPLDDCQRSPLPHQGIVNQNFTTATRMPYNARKL
jgi:hypothetical protein